jgi:hypothetical protein
LNTNFFTINLQTFGVESWRPNVNFFALGLVGASELQPWKFQDMPIIKNFELWLQLSMLKVGG